MRLSIIAILLLAILVGTGCTGSSSDDSSTDSGATPSTPSTGTAGNSGDAVTRSDIELTTGDVEQKVRLKGTVDAADRPTGLDIQEMQDPRNMLNMVTINLPQPYPDSLMLTFTLNSQRNWLDTPVVVRGSIVTDKTSQPLAHFQHVFGDNAALSDHVFKVDLMKALREQLGTMPQTLLITANIEGLLMPVGTDKDSVDPATATVEPLRFTQAIPYNPIRVNFLEGPAETPATPAPAPEASEPASAAAEPTAEAPAVESPAVEESAPAEETASEPAPADEADMDAEAESADEAPAQDEAEPEVAAEEEPAADATAEDAPEAMEDGAAQ